MSNFVGDEIEILEEELIENLGFGRTGADYPAASGGHNHIYFNEKCNALFKSSRIRVSKGGPYIIFRETEDDSGYKITRYHTKAEGTYDYFSIGCSKIFSRYGVNPEQIKRAPLLAVKGGGYAIKLY